jgi:hypothetical protein
LIVAEADERDRRVRRSAHEPRRLHRLTRRREHHLPCERRELRLDEGVPGLGFALLPEHLLDLRRDLLERRPAQARLVLLVPGRDFLDGDRRRRRGHLFEERVGRQSLLLRLGLDDVALDELAHGSLAHLVLAILGLAQELFEELLLHALVELADADLATVEHEGDLLVAGPRLLLRVVALRAEAETPAARERGEQDRADEGRQDRGERKEKRRSLGSLHHAGRVCVSSPSVSC